MNRRYEILKEIIYHQTIRLLLSFFPHIIKILTKVNYKLELQLSTLVLQVYNFDAMNYSCFVEFETRSYELRTPIHSMGVVTRKRRIGKIS